MVLSRDYDLSKLVTKDQLFRFKEEFGEHKQEVSERFNKIDTEIALIKQEIKALRKDTKADIDALKKILRLISMLSERMLLQKSPKVNPILLSGWLVFL